MKNKTFLFTVPSDPPSHMEALLLNSSAVYLKWKPPSLQTHNGKLRIFFQWSLIEVAFFGSLIKNAFFIKNVLYLISSSKNFKLR